MNARPVKGAAYETLIATKTFIVLDIETTTKAATKTSAETTYPISIGAVVWFNGSRRKTFHELTNPGVPVDKASSAHNGIVTEDLASCDDNATVLAKLDKFLAEHPDAYIVCHNAYFDIGHLHAAYTRASMTPFSRTVIDTMYLPTRLHLEDAVGRPKLTSLASQYAVTTSLTGVKPEDERLYKALLDAQNTAEVLGWLMAEAAALGVVEFDEFLTSAKATSSTDIASHTGKRRRHMRAPTITKRHIARCHGKRGLAATATNNQIDAWVAQVTECVGLRCPYAAEKVTREAHRGKTLLDKFDKLMATSTPPGAMGSLLFALEPLLGQLDRAAARRWYRKHHQHIKDAEACEPFAACPGCVAGRPCPKDITYQLVTRRAMDYGLTRRGGLVSLLSRQVKDDVWDPGSDRKMDTLPDQGMPEMAARMMWMVMSEAAAKGNITRTHDILNKSVARHLQEHDPYLALAVAKYWSAQPRKVLHDVPYHRLVTARLAKKMRTAKRKAKGLRKPADVELRPADVKHQYRYALHA
ncbi:MAG: 3'-5' exonuclease [Phycicoccus sp.]|nr:3'-5' exonuclease [Phycicoccus sp.]